MPFISIANKLNLEGLPSYFNPNKTNITHILKKKLLQKHWRSFRFTCDVWICKFTAVYVIISRRSYQQYNQRIMHLNKFWISMGFGLKIFMKSPTILKFI